MNKATETKPTQKAAIEPKEVSFAKREEVAAKAAEQQVEQGSRSPF
jgi:hypothetical protein